MKKNFTLKTRGILCCCTGVEIILPVFFLAVLCLPKALVEDSVNNDVVTKPYHIATPWGATEFTGGGGSYCVDGYKILVALRHRQRPRVPDLPRRRRELDGDDANAVFRYVPTGHRGLLQERVGRSRHT